MFGAVSDAKYATYSKYANSPPENVHIRPEMNIEVYILATANSVEAEVRKNSQVL